MRRPPPTECPVCGAAVPPKARACPHCGADERAGWNEEATRYDGLDLPDTAFEDGTVSRRSRRGLRPRLPWYWWVAAVLVIATMLLFSVGGR